ncbi:hypothetical protein [Halorubrum sp. F4]|uniref:hypothetical protein n=1 Tax=Halorubrum sp. F4 TaxID=2989715 RepID=UPI0024804C1F|nr:hypothetical protein [Halorubrum sp. F4]
MIPPSIPWIEVIRFGLLIAAAGFSFLIWRWAQIDSRRDREELIRNRYVTSDVIFRIPEDATVNDTHYEFSIYMVRVKEESGWRNFIRKILRADFHGTTVFSTSGLHDKGRDYMRSQAVTPSPPGTAPPKQKEPQLPDRLTKITESKEYVELGLEDDDLSVSDNSFTLKLQTADPAEVDEQIETIFGLINDIYNNSD